MLSDVEQRMRVLVEHFEQPPEAHAIAVFVHRILLRVGERRARPRIARAVERRQVFVMLDVRRDPERDARVVRPFDDGPVDDRQVVDAVRRERASGHSILL